ncbi:uncharacterized protein LOC100158280 [Xenopus laevis]|uniref:D-arabinitol 2-dehydrogenase [ribulose-forming] n=1 Tax=Xenopus laevis TaxID=8355 RepID=B1H1Q7_XENLA|nr:uncharacterized protein LOC100158280 [Xenopus laevis]AAI60700.1 LOC100158280 protein [Xenopus laevis]
MDRLAEHLEKITDLCSGSRNEFPDELRICLETASNIVAELRAKQGCADGACRNVSKQATQNWQCTGIDAYKMLAHLTRTKNILSLGSCFTSIALAMTNVIPQDGKIVLCLANPSPQDFQDHSLQARKIQRKVGETCDILKELAASGEQFDMVFIDATERSHINYYNLIMSSNMLKMNGVICVQNAFVKEHHSREFMADEEGSAAARKVTEVINSDPSLEQVTLPIDGSIIVARRRFVPPSGDVKDVIVKDDVFWGYKGLPILDRMRLDGKVAYVTGGGQGIGRAFAHALGEAGANVAVVDLMLEKAEAVAFELHLKGIKSVAIAADISKEEDVKRIVDTIVTNWGRIDIACNNAGINMNSASEDTTLQEWDKTFNVNLRGLFMCCQAAGRIMLSQGYGKIINTASMASLIVPHPQKQLAYNTSKAGVVKLTQTLGTEWIDRGVRVNCISPGIVDTPLIHSDALKPLVQRWLNDIPAGRLAQVTDLQAAVVFLASEVSDYMTGHNLVIEGGQSLW